MAPFDVSRAGAILAVADVGRSAAFYRDVLGFEVEAEYDDPPYATLSRAGTRLSLAGQGHPAEDRPGVAMVAPEDPARAAVVLVLEVADALTVHDGLAAAGADLLAPPYSPPWGGHRFFVRDPDGFLVEVEQPA
jgi:catechol 2,3-dioxygenase-like lactoylglutathione lyase family enzyme